VHERPTRWMRASSFRQEHEEEHEEEERPTFPPFSVYIFRG